MRQIIYNDGYGAVNVLFNMGWNLKVLAILKNVEQ